VPGSGGVPLPASGNFCVPAPTSPLRQKRGGEGVPLFPVSFPVPLSRAIPRCMNSGGNSAGNSLMSRTDPCNPRIRNSHHHHLHHPGLPPYTHGHPPAPHRPPLCHLHRHSPHHRVRWHALHLRESHRVVCPPRKTLLYPTRMGLCPGLDRALYPHGGVALPRPEKQLRQPFLKTGRCPLCRPACPEPCLVGSLLWYACHGSRPLRAPRTYRTHRGNHARLPAHLDNSRMAARPVPRMVLLCGSPQCRYLAAQLEPSRTSLTCRHAGEKRETNKKRKIRNWIIRLRTGASGASAGSPCSTRAGPRSA